MKAAKITLSYILLTGARPADDGRLIPARLSANDCYVALDEACRKMARVALRKFRQSQPDTDFGGALPAIFSGARVAATYAAVGAVFGEWAGSSAGLGFVILQAQPALATGRIFAAVLILSALALALYALVTLAERLLVPWQATNA